MLAGGLATRLRPVAQRSPRRWWTSPGGRSSSTSSSCCSATGVRRVVLCLGHLGDQIEARLGDGAPLGPRVALLPRRPAAAGDGGALSARAAPGRRVLGALRRLATWTSTTRAVLRRSLSRPSSGLMTVLANDDRWDREQRGLPRRRAGRVRQGAAARRTCRTSTTESRLLRAARSRAFRRTMPYDLADLYHDLVAERRLAGYEVARRFYEIGSPEGLEETRGILEQG